MTKGHHTGEAAEEAAVDPVKMPLSPMPVDQEHQLQREKHGHGHGHGRGKASHPPSSSPRKIAGSFERGDLKDAPSDIDTDKWSFLFAQDVQQHPASWPSTDVAMTRFNEDGYITMDSFLSKEGVRYLQDQVGQLVREKSSKVHLEWIMSPHQFLPPKDNWVWPIATNPIITSFVTKLLGDPVVLFSAQLAIKQPHSGTHVPWHQDGDNCCTVWIPLDRVDARNGSLQVQPHLHKKYVKTIVLPAGGLEIHHSCTPHSSPPNTSARPRRVLILRFQAVTEPIVGGPVEHLRTGETHEKLNYLIRVNRRDATAAAAADDDDDDVIENGGPLAAKKPKTSTKHAQ
ncbi:hypothetical protein PTSG_06214 [Salpingoeca rosetta]|uniref:Phytanoyl-CoA dioxygenase n=1 Tax=Salpingoeca rosetta (strain ATCC 50818 / BSB-021) TaxID=946362 RepID=F2UC95_SALR5|nr:uncharacterized protein PTSG_06214 [Salpingoeca rosetta]EGD74202.1 hypothetical protein PTSG_06214 [Salpingoeca rosetta]|eukprot:XP_004993102.1 hypothetical protein PTSG_06214 [Salpingoeca rosetta]